MSKPRIRKKSSASTIKKDHTVKVYQRDKINFQLRLAQPEWSPKQQELLSIIKHPASKLTLIKGPAGSSKTFSVLWQALDLLNSGRIKEIILVRSIAESGAISLGSLPGDSDEKLSPFMMLFNDKLREFLPSEDIKKLYDDKRLICVPINHMRGRQFDACFIIIEESQNLQVSEIQTVITRLGKYSKMALCGDTAQVDFVHGKVLDSGFKHFYDWYDKEEATRQGVHCFKFGIEDIKREEIVKYFVEQYDQLRETITKDYRPSRK